MNENQKQNRLYRKFVVSLHRHLKLKNYDSGIQNQELLFVAG